MTIQSPDPGDLFGPTRWVRLYAGLLAGPSLPKLKPNQGVTVPFAGVWR